MASFRVNRSQFSVECIDQVLMTDIAQVCHLLAEVQCHKTSNHNGICIFRSVCVRVLLMVDRNSFAVTFDNVKAKFVAESVINILAVDDDPYNLEIIQDLLEESNYKIDTAQNGIYAQRALLKNPDKYHTVLLDWMMPEMDGLHLLKFMKSHDQLRFIPVIMQTAKTAKEDFVQGLDAGVIYYLTKPFKKETLLAIVGTSVSSYFNHLSLCDELNAMNVQPIDDQEFTLKTLEEARALSTLLASICPDPKRVISGLNELLVNSIEHGNLEISYDEKTLLHTKGIWFDEIEHRLTLSKYKNKCVTVMLKSNNKEITFSIKDEGDGFNCRDFLEIDTDRAFSSHGRGIAIAKAISFDHIRYIDPGNEVIVAVNKDKA